jgi:histidine triad (HIT) family protein
MNKHEDCIFCKIVSGELPSVKVYEDDDILAYEDVNPQMPVHVLVIPKEHYQSIADDVPSELLGKMLAVVPQIARKYKIDGSGYRVIVNTGDDARQTVHHLHLHILGGGKMPINMGQVD